MFRIAICDDEKIYRDQLVSFLMRYAEQQGEEFQLICFESADRLLLNYPKDIDLLFLDIAMGGVDGMAAAREIRKFDPQVCIIFITTMYQRAIDGYAVKAFGFITKPVSEAELKHELTAALAMIRNGREREQFISFKSEGSIHRVPISHISYCEVRNHQILLNVDGTLYQYRDSMSELESRLAPLGFFRCHSSYLINGEYIVKIEPSEVFLRDGTRIPISQRKRKEFMQEISSFLGGTI